LREHVLASVKKYGHCVLYPAERILKSTEMESLESHVRHILRMVERKSACVNCLRHSPRPLTFALFGPESIVYCSQKDIEMERKQKGEGNLGTLHKVYSLTLSSEITSQIQLSTSERVWRTKAMVRDRSWKPRA